MGTFRYPRPDGHAATYWRRRFLALAGGLTVLALIAWAFSGAIGGGAATHAGGGSRGARAAHQPGQGPGGSGAGAAAVSGAQPSAPAGGSGDPAGPAGSPAAGSRPASTGPAPAGGRTRSCRRRNVVLSLSAEQDSFSSREVPLFDVDIVSTSASTCTFNLGAKHVMLVIRAGPVRIWGSADCVEGQGSLTTDLERGVPTVLPMSWDRQTSSPGCEIASSQVPVGTYAATAIDGTDISNTVTFRLG